MIPLYTQGFTAVFFLDFQVTTGFARVFIGQTGIDFGKKHRVIVTGVAVTRLECPLLSG